MKTYITKQFKFEAAHSLPNHDGKCKNLHGHSYILEVTVTGPIISSGPKEGMIMDFSELNTIVNQEIIGQWDHQFLNDLLPFTTTAENLAQECYRRLEKSGLDIEKIKLWETAKSFVEVIK
jgi:6-pyruvoyltetrahydropterin/6-carboxytetrahydropterin synthase